MKSHDHNILVYLQTIMLINRFNMVIQWIRYITIHLLIPMYPKVVRGYTLRNHLHPFIRSRDTMPLLGDYLYHYHTLIYNFSPYEKPHGKPMYPT
jgi:hypothetical protein